jgi:hypothetical protein
MAKQVRLRDVTLLTVTSTDIDRTNIALAHCAEKIEFGAVKMLCSRLPAAAEPGVQYIQIPPLDFQGYSKFMVESLNAYIQTAHCLVVQADGFVLDPNRWRDRFLEYDYVGAPWPEHVNVCGSAGMRQLMLDKNRVGNGGFSLRSKKLLEAVSRLQFDHLNFPLKSEDLLICHYLYDDMRAVGIRFAPPELAARFSIESEHGLYGQSLKTVFGFHGKHWLAQIDHAKAALQHKSFRSAPTAGLGRSMWADVGRNAPCPCGSGKKYKFCHGAPT